MAKLLSYFNLCPIMDAKDFLGVSEGKEEGTIINTLGRNIIIIIKLNSQKQMKSWATIDKLNTKVVYDKNSDRYVGGFGNNNLKCWNEKVEDLKKVKKVKTAKPIQDILTVSGTTVVVFTDGSCSALDTILNNLSRPENYNWVGPVPPGSKIVKVDTIKEESGVAFLTLLTEDDEEQRSLFYFKVHSADGEEEEAILDPLVGVVHLKRDYVKLLNSCVVLGNSGLVVLSIWSDKRMMRQEIRERVSVSDAGQFMEMVTFIKLDQSFSITSPAKNYIAIYGGNAHQDGSALMLYNIQYNIIEAKQNFKVHFNESRLWTLGTNILLATGQSLSVFPFYVAKEELLHLIGSMKNACHEWPAVQNDMIDEGSDAHNLIEYQQHIKPATFNIERRKKPLAAAEFDDLVEIMVATGAVGLLEDEGRGAECEITVNENPEGAMSLPIRTLVRAMEGQGFSEMEITNELIPNLASHGAERDLMAVLRKYTTLSESVIVECVHRAVRTENRKLLFGLLAIDFEEEYLIYHLRKQLAIEDVLFLVQFLYECLSGSIQCPDIADMDLCEVVLKWLTCLIDAHYTNILMSKSKQMAKHFTKWRILIETHIEELQQLSNFSARVQRVAHAKNTTLATSSKWYNIEVVRL